MASNQTKQTIKWLLNRRNGLKHGFYSDQTKVSVITRPNRREYGYKPDRNVAINQRKQTKIWVSTITRRPKYGFFLNRTDQKMGIDQTEQTEVWVLPRPNRPK